MWEIAGGIIIAVGVLFVLWAIFAVIWSMVVGLLEALDEINTPIWLLRARLSVRTWLSHLRMRGAVRAKATPPSVP